MVSAVLLAILSSASAAPKGSPAPAQPASMNRSRTARPSPEAWFGPVEVRFPASIAAGHAGPPHAADAAVSFQLISPQTKRPTGRPIVRLAHFVNGGYRAFLASQTPGRYTATPIFAGKPLASLAKTVDLRTRMKGSFVRVDRESKRFVLNGKPWWPIGINIGWNNGPRPLEADIEALSKAGGDWARIWACHWDGKNPFWVEGEPHPELGGMKESALARWDKIIETAERTGVKFQFVLFHHGLFSSRVNPNWPAHPWNKANGGFLENPADFFTDPTARRLAKQWLRTAVSRYGHSPSIMAWELFNEVEWVDARYDNRKEDIGRWHDEMAAYLREIDPVGRLVTSSSEMDLPIYRSADYYQPHGYVASVEGLLLGAQRPGDKPFFFGEVGPAGFDEKAEHLVLRNAIWSGLFAGHQGAGQYWYWDRVHRLNFWGEISFARKLLAQSGLLEDWQAAPFGASADAGLGGPLSILPGRGWGTTTIEALDLPKEATPEKAGQISSYFQGQAHRVMWPKPLRLRFAADKAGEMVVKAPGAARQGARFQASLNGNPVVDHQWPAQAEDHSDAKTFVIPYGPGRNEVVLSSTGADWFRLGEIVVPGLAPAARALGFGTSRAAIVRLRRSGSRPAALSGLPLRDGRYQVTAADLDAKTTRRTVVRVAKGALAQPWPGMEKDAVLLFRRAP